MCEANIQSKTLSDIYKQLCCHLTKSDDDEFSKLKRNEEKVDFAYKQLECYRLLPLPYCKRAKDNKMAADLREAGNNLFKQKKDGLALIKYTESIVYAQKDSEELALAFGNRSAVLYQLKLYKECLRDIENALSSNYPKQLHEKLMERKRKAEMSSYTQLELNYHENRPSLSYNLNQFIQSASSCIQLSFEENLGRHIVATQNIKVGDVIAIEEPFTKILLKENYLTHCYNCLKPSQNLMPCDNCVLVLYCNEGCKRLAANSFHKYECPILLTLLELNVNKLGLLALKICILAEFQHDHVSDTVPDSIYKSQNYREIHNLITNTNRRPISDLFEKAVTAAVIYELIEKYTDLLRDCGIEAKSRFKSLLFHHMQTGPSNFHEISEISRNRSEYYELDEIGSGAYAFLSLLNHSCSPNVIRHCYGSSIVLRALRPIVKGEQLFDNYGYHHAIMNKEERQKHLRKQYFFECECEACEKNWPLYHELPTRNVNIAINGEQITALQNGSFVDESVMEYLENTAGSLERMRPCKELADVQEILKQCYAVCGNKRQAL